MNNRDECREQGAMIRLRRMMAFAYGI